MEFFSESLSFLSVLKDSIKLLSKNVKVMTIIVLSSIFLFSSTFLLFNYSLQYIITDISVTAMQAFMPDPSSFQVPDPTADPNSFNPKTPGFDPNQMISALNHMKADISILFAIGILFWLLFSIISFVVHVATIIVSSNSYNEKTLSIKDLLSIIGKTYKRPMVTSFYVSGLTIGFFSVVWISISPLVILFPNFTAYLFTILIWIIFLVLFMYLFVTWGLAVVVSVVEEKYGIEALGKGVKLVIGKRLCGFLINVCLNLAVLIIFQIYKMVLGDKGLMNHLTIYGLFMLNISSLVHVFFCVAYTVFYFECKKHHNEVIGLVGRLEYSKLSNKLMVSDIP